MGEEKGGYRTGSLKVHFESGGFGNVLYGGGRLSELNRWEHEETGE